MHNLVAQSMAEDSRTVTDLDTSEESLRDKKKNDKESPNEKKKSDLLKPKKKGGKVLPKEKDTGIHITELVFT